MKNSYILLRNNIESSSLHIEDLEQIGLQETDLIWVECQSVCWQTPNEITELKKLLSADKLRPGSKKINDAVKNNSKTTEHTTQVVHKNKLVYVEMPAGNNSITENKVAPSMKESNSDEVNKYAHFGTAASFAPEKNNNSFKTNPDLYFADIKGDNKQSSSNNKNLQKTIFGFELPGNAKRITLYIGLVVIGALFMLFIMNNDHKNKIVFQPVTPQPEKLISTEETEEPEENNTTLQEVFEEQPFAKIETPEAIKNETHPSPIPTSKASDKKKNDTPEDPNPVLEMNSKKIQPINEIKIVKKAPIENISSKVTLKANNYNMGSFGGIKNLEVTMENESIYLLDKIAVEINYLNPEGDIVNSDKIYFQSIGPGDAATLPVKNSKRGVKIKLKVIKIESKELSDANSTSADPNNYSKS